jgi:hypothetical protein
MTDRVIITTSDNTHTYHSLEGSKWTVAIPHGAGCGNAYYEWHGEYGEMSGILEFDGRMLVEYDGAYELPKNVCRVLHLLGCTFDKYILPDGMVF